MAKTKDNKQNVLNKVTKFSISNIKDANNLKNSNKDIPQVDSKVPVRFLIPVSIYTKFNVLSHKFQGVVQSYEFSSSVVFFETFTKYMVTVFKEQKLFKEAPEEFVQFVTRKGRRAKQDGPYMNEKSHTFFINPSKEAYNQYLNLLYSYLLNKKDQMNRSYSVSLFFIDFVQMIEENLNKISKAYKEDKKKEL